MKKKLKIIGIQISCDNLGHEYLDSFKVMDYEKKFNVDALVSGCFDSEIDNLNTDEQIEWARKQIGRYLFVDDLVACTYSAVGKAYIV